MVARSKARFFEAPKFKFCCRKKHEDHTPEARRVVKHRLTKLARRNARRFIEED